MADGTGIVVVGNGYGSFTGRASLYVLNANTGQFIAEIPTPVTGSETDNGLSSVKLRVNSQNVVQAAYAGDLKGRLWKFDMSGAAASSWKVAFNGSPLFTAPQGASQSITVQPLLLDHPLNGKIVYFGTGKFSETTDKQTSALQDFYAIWDGDNGSGNIVEANLQPQAINGTVVGSGNTYYTTTSNDVDWGTKKGWYLPLATTAPYVGERIIYPAQTSRGRIIFTTAAVNSTDPCESTGTGRLFELNAATGSMLNYQVLDTNNDGDINSSDLIVSGLGIGTGIPVVASIVAGTNGTNDNKYVIDSSGGTPNKILEKAAAPTSSNASCGDKSNRETNHASDIQGLYVDRTHDSGGDCRYSGGHRVSQLHRIREAYPAVGDCQPAVRADPSAGTLLFAKQFVYFYLCRRYRERRQFLLHDSAGTTATDFTLTATPIAGTLMAGDKCGSFVITNTGARSNTGATSGVTTKDCWGR